VGIYRLSGSAVTIDHWRKAFDKGERVDLFKEPDPHAITGLLKLYLRELPEPLLTFEKYDHFIASQANPVEWTRFKLLKHLINSLPKENQALLKTLMQHLVRVNTHADVNKMQMANLATIFGPNLLRERSSDNSSGIDTSVLTMVTDAPMINALVLNLIQNYDYIFGDKEIPESVVYARALYAFAGEDAETELSFDLGAVIKVTQLTNADEWWTGEIDGKSGCFPGSYVELIHEDNSASSVQFRKLFAEVESKKKQIAELKGKVEATTNQLQETLKQRDEAAATAEHWRNLMSDILTQNPDLSPFSESVKEMKEKLAANKNTVLVEISSLVEELEQFNSKSKSKFEKAFTPKFEALKSKIEEAKETRVKLKESSDRLVAHVDFINKS